MSQAFIRATSRKIYLILLRRSETFHWRQDYFEILQHIKTSWEGFYQPPPPLPLSLYHDGGMNLRVLPRVRCPRFWLICNKFVGSHSFLIKRGRKVHILNQTNWPIFWHQNVKISRPNCWRHSYVNLKLKNISSILKEPFKESWKLRKIQYLKYELRYKNGIPPL